MLQPLLEILMNVISCADPYHFPAIEGGLFLYEIMKRLSIILFSAYYLFAISGVTVHYHYCCGKLASMDLYSPRKNPCPCGENEGKSGCCDHKVLVFKIKESTKTEVSSCVVAAQSVMLAVNPPVAVTYPPPFLERAVSIPVQCLQYFRKRSFTPLYLVFRTLRN